MNSMLVAANAVLPIAFMMFLGAFLKSRKIVRDTSFKDFNWVVFHVCLPLTLFNSIQGMDPEMLTDPAIVIFALCSLAVVIILAMVLIGRMKLDDRQKGVMVQAIYRSNFVILGIPIIESIYGTGNTGPTPLLVAFVVPVFNVVSVLILSHYSGAKGNIAQTVKKVFTNPLIIGAILGFIYKFSGITMPVMISGIISQITKMSTPLSLLVLGGSFEFVSVKNNMKLLTISPRFLISSLLIFLFFLTWRILFHQRTIIGVVFALLFSLSLMFLYRDEIRIVRKKIMEKKRYGKKNDISTSE